MKNNAFIFIACVIGFSLCSCSTGFNREWSKATAQAAAQPPKDITGPWRGTWRSDANGHHGELRCIVSSLDSKTGSSRFHYHATFLNTLSATYDVTHVVKYASGGFTFSGDQMLTGLGGGMYHYEGKGTPLEFHATYRSASDHGVFEMKRP